MKKIINWFINLYAIWIVLTFIAGYLNPSLFIWFNGNLMTIAMAIVMLGMGMTLNFKDLQDILTMPRTIFIAALSQYTIMPLSGVFIAYILRMPPELAAGLILLACCPGGTASNLIAYIGRANLALSVISTMVSTLLGIVITPLLCQLFAGQYVPVDGWGMFKSTVIIVLVPVLLGAFINYTFPKLISKIGQTGPTISTIAIIFISGGIISQSADIIRENSGILIIAAAMLHTFGFTFGYYFARILGYNHKFSKAISCETGMQNGGLAAVLAKRHFTPAAAAPAVFCSIMQTVIGGIIGSIWRYLSRNEEKENLNTSKA
jgi:BASS family bile acid:Na+ symporter